jgi:hypothetical protein
VCAVHLLLVVLFSKQDETDGTQNACDILVGKSQVRPTLVGGRKDIYVFI